MNIVLNYIIFYSLFILIDDCVVDLKQEGLLLYFWCTPHKDIEEVRLLLDDYFNLSSFHLGNLCQEWSKPKGGEIHSINAYFEEIAPSFNGLRLIRQDPRECLFSFICSQNNNVKRISSLVDALCENYGDHIVDIDGKGYYRFPKLEQLSKASEKRLRELKFGYRGKYIVKATQQIIEKGGDQWLLSMRSLPTAHVHDELVKLTGIGTKVANCISLYSLDKYEVVPVDTHIWKISQRFMKGMKNKNLNPSLHKDIGEFFINRFGKCAGWAHIFLFASYVSSLRDVNKKL